MTDTVLLRIKSDLHYAIQRVDSSICYLSSVIENYDALPEDIRINLDDAFISLDETRDEMECILEDIEEMEVSE